MLFNDEPFGAVHACGLFVTHSGCLGNLEVIGMPHLTEVMTSGDILTMIR